MLRSERKARAKRTAQRVRDALALCDFYDHMCRGLQERENAAPKGTTHACPLEGSAVTPCCHRSPFELSRTDRMTAHRDLVTCRTPAAPKEPTKSAAELLRERAERDPEGHRRSLAQGYGVGPELQGEKS